MQDDTDNEPLAAADPAASVELVRRILDGDRDAFDDFVEMVLPVVQRFARSRLGSEPDLVGDVVQSTLCKAIEGLSRYRGDGSLLSWACGICRHEILAVYRGRSRRPLGADVGDPDLERAMAALASVPTPDHEFAERELRSLVHLTLDHLPQHYSGVLEMKYAQNRSVAEIARALDASEKTVESRLTRAREAFRSTWSEVAAGVVGSRKR